MGEFLTRAISVVAVVVCLNGYNTVLDKREQAEEQIRKQQAELEQSGAFGVDPRGGTAQCGGDTGREAHAGTSDRARH